MGDTLDARAFIDWINVNALIDLGATDNSFTWTNGTNMPDLTAFLLRVNGRMPSPYTNPLLSTSTDQTTNLSSYQYRCA